MKAVLDASAAIGLPLLVFLLGGAIMTRRSDRPHALQQLNRLPDAKDRVPLSRRARYDLPAVRRYFGAFDDRASAAERKFLEMDLVFPFLYGGALTTGLLWMWASLGRPFSVLYLIAPIAITLLADWTENVIQLAELRRFVAGGPDALSAGCIAFASAATVTKLAFFSAASVLLLGLASTSVIRTVKGA